MTKIIKSFEKTDLWKDRIFIYIYTDEDDGERKLRIRGETRHIVSSEHEYDGWGRITYKAPKLILSLKEVCEWDPNWAILKAIEEYPNRDARIIRCWEPQTTYEYANKMVAGDGDGSIDIGFSNISTKMQDGYYVI